MQFYTKALWNDNQKNGWTKYEQKAETSKLSYVTQKPSKSRETICF
jgi:hypothetical protein